MIGSGIVLGGEWSARLPKPQDLKGRRTENLFSLLVPSIRLASKARVGLTYTIGAIEYLRRPWYQHTWYRHRTILWLRQIGTHIASNRVILICQTHEACCPRLIKLALARHEDALRSCADSGATIPIRHPYAHFGVSIVGSR